MTNFNYKSEFKKLVTEKQLVEINFRGDEGRITAYLFFLNDEYIVFGEISDDATFHGTSICLTHELESIQTETKFVKEFSQNINKDGLHQEAWKCIQNIKGISFKDFITAFQENQNFISIKTVDGAVLTGRVFAHDDEALVFDEYYLEENERFSRTYINPSLISSITVGGTWLKILEQSLD